MHGEKRDFVSEYFAKKSVEPHCVADDGRCNDKHHEYGISVPELLAQNVDLHGGLPLW
jgi:hypothetical protein